MNTNNYPDTMSTVIDNGINISSDFNENDFEDYVIPGPSYICTDNFDCLESEQDQMFHRSAYNCITQLELWDWLKQNNGTFMLNMTPEMKLLEARMMKDEINSYHSGSSYAGIMRQMEFIANHGYEVFRQQTLRRNEKARIKKQEALRREHQDILDKITTLLS